MRKKTVLLCSNLYRPNIGGIENSLYHLGEAYLDKGFNVIVVASDIESGGQALPSESNEDGMTIYRYQVQKSKSLVRFLNHWVKSFLLLKKLKNLYDPDIIVCRYHQTCLILLLAGYEHFTYLIPGIVKNQNTKTNLSSLQLGILQRLKAKFKYRWSAALQNMAIRQVPFISVFSQNMLNQLALFKVKKSDELLVTKPGVSLERFVLVNSEERNQLRERLNLPKNRKIFLCIGRFVRAKGFDLAIKAISHVDGAFLCIVGSGSEMTQYEQLIDQLNLKECVGIFPPSDTPELFYAAADYFLMPSRYEPLGQTILEGLASGLPIVAFDDNVVETATAEIMETTPFFRANSLDARSLSSAMKNALAIDNEAYKLMENYNRQFAQKKFSWTALATALEKQLER